MHEPVGTLNDYTVALARMGVDLDALQLDEAGTICNPLDAAASDGPPLPPLCGPQGEITIRAPLSRGGAGQILLARQTSLQRDVVVKRLAPELRGTAEERELLVEARVAGQLEHPNIVPVHMLGIGDDGRPLMVMKRIEGRSWKTLMAERRDLDRDVAILMEVCRALHFAHSRGVVHRDVKPANVMVGSFDEVYLVDWGIAVGTTPEAPATALRPSDVRGISGTPHYMAPEMATPGGIVDARTDVFLAGAVLFEIVTGQPPYAAASVQDALYAAYVALEPVFGPDVPEELAAICRAAMKRDPDERIASAEDLRVALAGFREHAAARRLCADAEERLARLRGLPPEAEARLVLALSSEVRFGFSQALEMWPESARARDGIRQAITCMAERELTAGRYDSARLLLDELAAPPPSLVAALGALRERRDAEARSVDALAHALHDKDGTVAERERAALLAVFAACWLLMSIALAVLGYLGTWRAGGGTLLVLDVGTCIAVGIAAWRLPRLRATHAARAAVASMVLSPLALASVHATGWWFDVPHAPLLAMSLVVLGVTVADRALEDPRIWSSALAAWCAFPLVLAWPQHAFVVSGVAGGTCLLLATAAAGRGLAPPSR